MPYKIGPNGQEIITCCLCFNEITREQCHKMKDEGQLLEDVCVNCFQAELLLVRQGVKEVPEN